MLRAPAILFALCFPAITLAARPTLSGPEILHDTPDGRYRIHYTLSGRDALVDPRDADPANGLPDFVDDVAEGIARCYRTFVDEDGWPRPPADEGRGGDDRLDVYVRLIDIFGYAHYELVASGESTSYLEINPQNGSTLGRTGTRSVAAHEFHHALQAAVTRRALPFLYEATATWAQYQLYQDLVLDLSRGALWVIRLKGAARPLDDVGQRFEYAGMVWLKFLLDHGQARRTAVLDLWRSMAKWGGAEGHRRAVSSFGLQNLEEAAATFAEWNLFACHRDDGRHYTKDLGCVMEEEVPTIAPSALPATGVTSPVGARGAAYLDVPHDCATAIVKVKVSASGPFAVRAVRVRAGGRSSSDGWTVPGGEREVAIPGFNDDARTVLALVNLGDRPLEIRYQAAGEGLYTPAPDLAAAVRLQIGPSGPLALRVGEEANLRLRGAFRSCADGADISGRALWRSTAAGVVAVEAGHVRAVGPGLAEVFVAAGDVESNRVRIEVRDPLMPPVPERGCGCAEAGGQTPGLFLAALALLRRRTPFARLKSSRARPRFRIPAVLCASLLVRGSRPKGRLPTRITIGPLVAFLLASSPGGASMPMSLASSAFEANGEIPPLYTCEGKNLSPPLTWTNLPAGAKSLVLIVDDPDAPDPKAPERTWVHWVLLDIPASAKGLPEGVKQAALPAGSMEGLNDWKRTGYGGPCPPIGRHRYFFKLYALDRALDLEQPGKAEVEKAMEGRILAKAELVGTYQKRKK
jgi:Raf kinase inhibitor-like YbhB/YbcL family protein